MAGPPRDADGFVLPHDDPQSIPNDARLVRYINSSQLIPTSRGLRRLSNGAFSKSSRRQDRYQGMSADMLDLMERDGVNPLKRLGPNHEGAVVIAARDLRELGLKVGPAPTDSNPYHASAWGVRSGLRKHIRNRSVWLIQPENTLPADGD